jgi:hypothetical protein
VAQTNRRWKTSWSAMKGAAIAVLIGATTRGHQRACVCGLEFYSEITLCCKLLKTQV